MLARTPRLLCVECGLAWGQPGFVAYHGDPLEGPAYWSDVGLLCSPRCAGVHFRHRVAEGTLPDKPVECPIEAFRD